MYFPNYPVSNDDTAPWGWELTCSYPNCDVKADITHDGDWHNLRQLNPHLDLWCLTLKDPDTGKPVESFCPKHLPI
jgi:hypothetical protein